MPACPPIPFVSVAPARLDTRALPLLATVLLLPALAGLLLRSAVAGLPFVIALALYLALVTPVRYQLHPDHLHIRSGLLCWRIPYAQMHSIRPTPTRPLSPARLDLTFSVTRHALISPPDPSLFLAGLLDRAPQLRPPSPDQPRP